MFVDGRKKIHPFFLRKEVYVNKKFILYFFAINERFRKKLYVVD